MDLSFSRPHSGSMLFWFGFFKLNIAFYSSALWLTLLLRVLRIPADGFRTLVTRSIVLLTKLLSLNELICAVKMNSCSFLEMTHSTEIALYRRKKVKVIPYSFSWPIEMNYFFIQFFSSNGGYRVFLSKACVEAHLISTDLLREGCFSVLRPGSFNTNVGLQCQLNNCYRGFLSSINCWSPVSSPVLTSLPACLRKPHCHCKRCTLA